LQQLPPRRGSIPAPGARQPSSGKLPDTHPVGAIYNHNLGVFTVTKIAMENTVAVSPAHPVPGTPQAAYPGLQRCRGPSAPLACLAWPPAWQSLCTGHLDASLKLGALTFAEPGLPRAEVSPNFRPDRLRVLAFSSDRNAESQTQINAQAFLPIQVSGPGSAEKKDSNSPREMCSRFERHFIFLACANPACRKSAGRK
jgi:hypothetical protein